MLVLTAALVVAEVHLTAFIPALAALVALAASFTLQNVDDAFPVSNRRTSFDDFNEHVQIVQRSCKCATTRNLSVCETSGPSRGSSGRGVTA